MNSTSPTKTTRRGFTLIELLIVISIIALLAAILFPVFSRARESARRASCQSNLKQIGLGIMQYTQDFDEMMPRSCFSTASNQCSETSIENVQWKWMDAIYPYVKSEQLFMCPSALRGSIHGFTSTKFSGRYRYATGFNWGNYAINNGYGNITDWIIQGPLGRKVS